MLSKVPHLIPSHKIDLSARYVLHICRYNKQVMKLKYRWCFSEKKLWNFFPIVWEVLNSKYVYESHKEFQSSA